MYGTISTTYHCVCFPNYRSGCVDLATECLPPSECPNLPPHTHHTSRCRLLELGSNSKSNNRIHSYLNTQSNSSVIGPRRLSRPPALHVIRPTGRPIHANTCVYMNMHALTRMDMSTLITRRVGLTWRYQGLYHRSLVDY